MGRTGRKRSGKVIVLLMKGKEYNSFLTSMSKRNNLYKVIKDNIRNDN